MEYQDVTSSETPGQLVAFASHEADETALSSWIMTQTGGGAQRHLLRSRVQQTARQEQEPGFATGTSVHTVWLSAPDALSIAHPSPASEYDASEGHAGLLRND
ncbi:MAG TPA: hypothetical protein VHS58_20205 [Acetobacteraceae bacterium]|jgi:hypothetical protein|nr:hypothetical protein [Acetobacteraceae bacterium]